MRQAGVLACCGLIALRDMVDRLEEDHSLATQFFKNVMHFPGIKISKPQTNIVKFSFEPAIDLEKLVQSLRTRNVWMMTVDEGTAVRAVTHLHIDPHDVQVAATVLKDLLSTEFMSE